MVKSEQFDKTTILLGSIVLFYNGEEKEDSRNRAFY